MGEGKKPGTLLLEVSRLLDEADFDDSEKELWLARLQNSHLSETSIVKVLADPPEPTVFPATKSYLAYHWVVMRHKARRWWSHEKPIWRALYAGGWLFLLLTPVIQQEFSWKVLLAAGIVVASKLKFVIGDVGPKNMKLLKRGYEERKYGLRKLIEEQQLWLDEPPTPREIHDFQENALKLVAHYVRHHRSDHSSTKKIFTNLIIKENNEVVVIARSDPGRIVPVRCSGEQCTLAWQTLTTGRAQFTGDLYVSSPTTPEGKQYHSVLTMPIWRRGVLVGAVSIDSGEKHHFDGHFDELLVALGPYTQLIAQTLNPHYALKEEADE